MPQGFKLTVYSMNFCPDCKQVTNLLDEKGVEYELIKIDEERAAGDLLEEKTGKRGVPYFFINDLEWWRAYQPGEAFDSAFVSEKLGI